MNMITLTLISKNRHSGCPRIQTKQNSANNVSRSDYMAVWKKWDSKGSVYDSDTLRLKTGWQTALLVNDCTDFFLHLLTNWKQLWDSTMKGVTCSASGESSQSQGNCTRHLVGGTLSKRWRPNSDFIHADRLSKTHLHMSVLKRN